MAETRLATMDVTAMSRLALTFDQNLLLMSGAVLPAIILCVMQYFFLEFLGERFQLVAISAALSDRKRTCNNMFVHVPC